MNPGLSPAAIEKLDAMRAPTQDRPELSRNQQAAFLLERALAATPTTTRKANGRPPSAPTKKPAHDGAMIKGLREKAGLTQPALGELVGLSRSAIMRIEVQGQAIPKGPGGDKLRAWIRTHTSTSAQPVASS